MVKVSAKRRTKRKRAATAGAKLRYATVILNETVPQFIYGWRAIALSSHNCFVVQKRVDQNLRLSIQILFTYLWQEQNPEHLCGQHSSDSLILDNGDCLNWDMTWYEKLCPQLLPSCCSGAVTSALPIYSPKKQSFGAALDLESPGVAHATISASFLLSAI